MLLIQADFAKNFFNVKWIPKQKKIKYSKWIRVLNSESIANSQNRKRIHSKFAKKIEYLKWSGETGSEFIENLRKEWIHNEFSKTIPDLKPMSKTYHEFR